MDVNAESHQRRTPLHEATGHHNIEAALITLGAKVMSFFYLLASFLLFASFLAMSDIKCSWMRQIRMD